MNEAPLVSLEAIAREQASVLENLLELYCYDFSELVPLDLKPSGRFEYPLGEAWWTDANHFPFFIRSGEKLVGFALARRGSRITSDPQVMDVAEFFVLKSERRAGIGRRAAHALFAKFAEPWQVRVRVSNAPAQQFWSRAVEAWLGHALSPEPHSVSGTLWNVLQVPPVKPRGAE